MAGRSLPALAALLALGGLLALPAQAMAQNPAPATGFDLPRLMHLLAQAPAAETPYVETKYSPLLAEPLVSSGTLAYRRPDTVEKSMSMPRAERFRITGDELVLSRGGGGERRVPLASQPLLQAFAASLRGVLSGNAELLRRHFSLALDGGEQDWRLEMRPLEAEVLRHVERITVAGRAGRVERIEVHETSGDRSVTQVR